MFDIINPTGSLEMAQIPTERIPDLWAQYIALSDEERFAMFKILTADSIYTLPVAECIATLMVGLLRGGIPGYHMALGGLADAIDPNAEQSIFADADFDDLL